MVIKSPHIVNNLFTASCASMVQAVFIGQHAVAEAELKDRHPGFQVGSKKLEFLWLVPVPKLEGLLHSTVVGATGPTLGFFRIRTTVPPSSKKTSSISVFRK